MAGRKSDFTLTKLDDLFTTQAQREEEKLYKIRDIPLGLIDDFPDHPFKVRDCSDVTYTTMRLEDFFADIKEQALGLVEIYHQKIDWKAGQSDKKVTIAYDPMFRAVMNMIQNAVEHTKENGIIYIDAKEQDGRLTFIVEDSGSGFTKEALLHGTEQFFMDDTSRNGEAHYGMGLFFAKTVAEKYGGGIKLSNSENTGGERVEIFFLSSQETS